MLINQTQPDSGSSSSAPVEKPLPKSSPLPGVWSASQPCWSPQAVWSAVLTSDRDVFTFHSSPDQHTLTSDRDLLSDLKSGFDGFDRNLFAFLEAGLSFFCLSRIGHSSLSRLFTLSWVGRRKAKPKQKRARWGKTSGNYGGKTKN